MGSAGRAAAALRNAVEIELFTYVSDDTRDALSRLAERYDLDVRSVSAPHGISFTYPHGLAGSLIEPHLFEIQQAPAFQVEADTVLRFGMMEGEAIVKAKTAVYDPQSPVRPSLFHANGSTAGRLALVLNASELSGMSGETDLAKGAQALLDRDGAEVVFVKCGADGALVVDRTGTTKIPAFLTSFVYPIGSGDIFAALIALHWALWSESPADAAMAASRGVAHYVENCALPLPPSSEIEDRYQTPITVAPGQVYLAGPFFTMSQRRLIEETRNILAGDRLAVFSPLHDVGMGAGKEVAGPDLKGLVASDRVLAILDGLDPGTIFEIGYARAKGIPVFAYAEDVPRSALTMIEGSGCMVIKDYATAIHRTIWKR